MYVNSSCKNVLLWFNKALGEYCAKYVHVDIDLNKMPSLTVGFKAFDVKLHKMLTEKNCEIESDEHTVELFSSAVEALVNA